MGKGLDRPDAFDLFVDHGRLFAADTVLGLEILEGMTGNKAGHKQAEGGQDDHHQGDQPVDGKHERQRADDGEHPGKQLGKAHQQAVAECIHVRDHPADQVAGGMAVQIFQGQPLDFFDGRVAQLSGDAEHDPVVAQAHQPLHQGGSRRQRDDPDSGPDDPVKIHLRLADHTVDGAAGKDRHEQLRPHANACAEQAENDIVLLPFDIGKHPAQRLFVPRLFFGRMLCFRHH